MHFPDPRLRDVSAPVKNFGAELQTLIDDMFETMQSVDGIGLAAIQLAVPLRISVINVEEPLALINPQITVLDAAPATHEEGCLSLPGIRTEVARPKLIKVEAADRTGDLFDLKAEGLLAACIQHEVDHMDGKLLMDRISPLKRTALNTELRNLIALHQNRASN